MGHFLDLAPPAAVAEARRRAAGVEGAARDEIVQQLDRYLRARVLGYLQSRSGDLGELEEALLRARSWAQRETLDPAARWQFLIGLLLDAGRTPSRLEQMHLLTDRASSVLFKVIEAGEGAGAEGIRPKVLAQKVGTSEQNVNNYLRRLEENGLISRFRPQGSRATYVFPTALGIGQAAKLSPGRSADRQAVTQEPASSEKSAAKADLWPGLHH